PLPSHVKLTSRAHFYGIIFNDAIKKSDMSRRLRIENSVRFLKIYFLLSTVPPPGVFRVASLLKEND
ncbi:MAG: hypothetical protein KAI75_06370, partial [Desulfobulbaceae bacterium]|nr:hypothetical protein [Desulfobulbaceae bacterium]